MERLAVHEKMKPIRDPVDSALFAYARSSVQVGADTRAYDQLRHR